MPTHRLTCSGREELVRDPEPTYHLALDWSCDGVDFGKVETSLPHFDVIRQVDVGDDRFFAAMAVEMGHALEIDVCNGEARHVWAADAWPVIVGAQAVARRAQADHDMPALVPGTVMHTFEA